MTRPAPYSPQTLNRSYVALPLLLGLLLGPAAGHASALGEVETLSTIGQPLRVEIAVAGAADQLAGECLQSVSDNVDDGVPTVRNARFEVARAGGQTRVIVTHPVPVSEPLLRLTVQNACGGARLTRAYTLLLPSPGAATPTPAARATAQAAPAPRAGQRWTTVRGESVDSLAQAMYPRDSSARGAFVASVLRGNPEVFGNAQDGAAARILPTGSQLLVPDVASVIAAASQANRTRSPRVVERTQSPPRQPDVARTTVAAETPRAPSDRLLLRDTDAPALVPTAAHISAAATGVNADERAREAGLVNAVDRTIDIQLELLERIRRLEEIQAAMRAQLGAPALAPTTGNAVVATKESPRADVRTSSRAESGREVATEPTLVSPAHLPGSDSDTTRWGLAALVLLALAGVLVIRRLTPIAPAPERSTSSHGEAAPAPAHRATIERVSTHTVTPPPTAAVPATPAFASPLAWETDAPSASAPAHAPTSLISEEDAIEDHDSAIELAEIMMSFGRTQGAAETLADFIRTNPKQAVTPWLKLMELYHKTNKRAEFDALAQHLNKTFNVSRITWDNFGTQHARSQTLEHLPHIAEQLVSQWRTRECQAYIEVLLRDNRDGTRQGFPLGQIDELLVLAAILESELGRYKSPGTS